jgi:hypothetical protein
VSKVAWTGVTERRRIDCALSYPSADAREVDRLTREGTVRVPHDSVVSVVDD